MLISVSSRCVGARQSAEGFLQIAGGTEYLNVYNKYQRKVCVQGQQSTKVIG